MVETLPGDWATRVQKLHQATPWVWLWELEADVTAVARTVFRVVAYPSQISATVQDVVTGTPTAMTFYPLNMDQTPIDRNTERNLPQMELRVSTVGRAATPYFEQGAGFMGQRATAWLLNLYDTTVSRRIGFRVAGATVTATAAVLRLELPNYYKRQVPEDVYRATRCRWRFGGAECGYIVNGAAAYATCAKHITDCVARGDDMAARNLPRLQPLRFGAFLGVPAA